ncbi:IS30 family transposase [Hydrogenophaga palleronii]|uniref:IS30 family transposase n=1 Tax=Hydrogenophaga palleronii TaxID=65655 RepID=UPI0008267C5D|nr:IS30 family transposase [Hydrogenophaga palleronii]
METRKRGLTAQERQELWSRWKSGQTLTAIGTALGKAPGSIYGFLATDGGIAPRQRCRTAHHLRVDEREEISRGLMAGVSLRQIAAALGRSPSTISKEIARNGGFKEYRAVDADRRAWQQAMRPKPCRLANNIRLRDQVAAKLQENWSPQQIAGWLRKHSGGDPSMELSHETIYRSLFIQARGVLKKELMAHLRSRRLMRRAKASTTKGQPRGQIIDAVSIRERPAQAEDRAIPGHWEGDLISGAKNSHIATLVERRSRYVVLVQLKGKDTTSVVDALMREVQKLPTGLINTLTWDRGSELAQHKRFTLATAVQVYFCDPRSPWQRGTNENTNGLLRQYFPKGTDLSVFDQAQLDVVAAQLNTRPRLTLGFETPADTLTNLVLP